MPVWGAPLKQALRGKFRLAIRGARAVQNPMAALRMAMMQVLATMGMSFLMPLVSVIIPMIQTAIKIYVDNEIKRRFEEERKKLYTEVYSMLTEQDRALFRELVPG